MDLYYEDIQNKSEVIPIKTKEELAALREEVAALNKKLRELTEEELAVVTGGASDNGTVFNSNESYHEKEIHIYENTIDEFEKPTW